MQSFTLSSLLSESAIYMESSLGQGLSRVMNAAYNWILNWLRPEGTNLIPRIVWLNGCGDQATFSVLDMTSEQDWGGSGRTCTVQGICSLDGNRTSFSGLINGSLFVSTPSPPQLLSLWVQKLLVKSWSSLFPFFKIPARGTFSLLWFSSGCRGCCWLLVVRIPAITTAKL